MVEAAIQQDLARRFGSGRCTPLVGRGNSQVGIWQANEHNAPPYFIKAYPHDPEWNRRETERRALQFYTEHGILAVPSVLHSDAVLNYSVLTYIDGTPSYEVDATRFDMIRNFLQAVTVLPGVADFVAMAKEAFLHTSELRRHIELRREFLWLLDEPRLRSYLHDVVDPTFAEADYGAVADVACDRKIIVSPSDFGTHNTLLTPNNRLYFIDFEYAGRDSLFKLLGDIYWHPGSTLSQRQRIDLITPYLVTDHDRVVFKTVRLLMGMKWSLLLLNEFAPRALQKRLAAASGQLDIDTIKNIQLEKSRAVLNRLLQDARGDLKEFN